MTIDLPSPPSTNEAYNPFGGRLILAKVGREYKAMAQGRLLVARWKPFDGDVVLTIHWRRKIKSGDLSNRIKVLEDSLKGFAWRDDGQVVELHAYRTDDKANPGVTVTVEPL